MKNTLFFAQWKNYPATVDKTMTRKRACNLIKAWRANSRKNSNSEKWIFKRLSPHVYFVKIREYDDESHTLFVGVKP